MEASKDVSVNGDKLTVKFHKWNCASGKRISCFFPFILEIHNCILRSTPSETLKNLAIWRSWKAEVENREREKKIQLPGKVVYKCAQIFTRCQKRERIGACSSHLYTSLSGRWVCVCVCALDRDPRNVYSGWVLKPEITWYLERNFIVFRLPRNNLKPSVKMSIEQTKKATMTIFSKTRRWQ